MKLAFVFLACFVGITWQQEVFVRQSPQGFYYSVNNYAHQYPAAYHHQAFQQPAHQQYVQQPAQQQYVQLPAQQQYYEPVDGIPYVYHQSNPAVEALPHPIDAALPYDENSSAKQIFRPPLLQVLGNFFGFGGGNRPLRPLRPLRPQRPQSASTVVVVSVVTNEVVSFCLTRTMFAATTACRRRRSILDIISADDLHADEAPTASEPLNSAIEELPREGRDVNAADNIQSSRQDEYDDASYYYYANPSDALAEEFLRQRRPTVTSVSYSVTNVIKTLTNSKLAASGALSCVPAGQTLC